MYAALVDNLCTFSDTLSQIFGVPPGARRAKPFIDHILSFSILDNKVWFRNFQVFMTLSVSYFRFLPTSIDN